MAHNRASSSFSSSNVIAAAVIIAFAAAGGYAVYGKLSDNIANKAEETTNPTTVEELAEASGQSVKELLEENGITDDSVTKDTSVSDFYDLLTIGRVAAYNGTSVDSLVSQYGITGDVTDNTMWVDAKDHIPLGTYFGIDSSAEDAQTTFDSYKQMFGFGDDVTMDTEYGDVKDIMEAALNATAAPADTEAPAETDAAQSTEASSAPEASAAAQ